MTPQTRFEKATHYNDALARAADECGIYRDYWDIFHKRHLATSEIRRGILQALGWDVSTFEALERERRQRFERQISSALPKTVVINVTEKTAPVTLLDSERGNVDYEIHLEEGGTLGGSIQIEQMLAARELFLDATRRIVYWLPLPAELPLGFHVLKISVNQVFYGSGHLIVCPDRAYVPENLANGGRTAGFNVALYGLRSRRNWGCGDFTDLRPLVDWAHNVAGFTMIGVNPLHALHNRAPYNTSPYLPLSMFYKNFIYIDVEAVPDFVQSPCAQRLFHSPRVQQLIQRLRDAQTVQYQDVHLLKRRFLKLLFRQFRRTRSQNSERARQFVRYCEQEGEMLHHFALYCTLDELLHKENRNWWTWHDWPPEYQSPYSEASRAFARQHAATVDFYRYAQFVIEEQLTAAQKYAKDSGMAIGLYHDLAVATDSYGSDLWAHREFYVNGCRVGAPPDDFSPNGQDWGFPPPNMAAHRDSGYKLYRESIHKIVRHGGALRMDHVMRLFRLFWIPEGLGPANGMYVADNETDLLRILALESVRSRNVIVGEDLGTVTDEMRDTLAAFGILSYRLFYFEKHQTDGTFKHSWEYPRQALVSSTTHDLPTLFGFWKGRDIQVRKDAGLADDAGYQAQLADRNREKQRILDLLHSEQLLPANYPQKAEEVPEIDGDLHNAIIGFLARVPSMILLLNQEDFTQETDQQNLPGSTGQYPNWQHKMKIHVEDLSSASCQPYTDMFRHQLILNGRKQ